MGNVRFRASFLSFIFHMRLRRYFISAALETFFGNAFLPSFGTLSLGASVCGEREGLGCFSPKKLILSAFLEFLKVSLYYSSKLLYINAFTSYFFTMGGAHG